MLPPLAAGLGGAGAAESSSHLHADGHGCKHVLTATKMLAHSALTAASAVLTGE